MIMDRKEQIEAANPYGNSSDFSAGKKIGFVIGAEWADAHPKMSLMTVSSASKKRLLLISQENAI